MSLSDPQAEPSGGLTQIFALSPAGALEALRDAASPEGSPAALVALRALVRASTHSAALTPILADIERVALLNVQIHAALDVLAARPNFAPARLLRRASAEERVVRAFLEYIAFASPAFLGSVGEWPLGQQRG